MEDAMLKKAAAKSPKEVEKLREAFETCLEPPAIPDGVVDFLRQNSPSAEVNIRTKYPSSFNLKQIEESIKGAKINNYGSRFSVPSSSKLPRLSLRSSSSVAPASADKSASEAAPASATEPAKSASDAAPASAAEPAKSASEAAPASATEPAKSASDAAPASAAEPAKSASDAAPTSAAEPASAASPYLHLCLGEKDDKSSNKDEEEKHQHNTDSPLQDNGL
ncbi:hypothetical protein RYX36_035115 [Vicia faba]